jgi:putative membrane protein
VAGSYVRFFFLGAVAGGIPLILASARVKRFSVWCVLLPIVGAGLVYSLNFLPEEMFSLSETVGVGAFLLKFAGGVLLAIALVLPGVSASQMLYTLGIYEEMMACIGELRLLPLVPIGIGTAVGIVLVTKTLETLMTRYPRQTFLIIFGFILGSIPELYPQNVEGNSLLCGVCVAVGFLLAYLVGKRERGKEEE